MKKLISILIAIAVTFTSLWGMAGFESYIPDISGEYVYYKDNTFLRESYIGILYYDDSTLQIRYYAPRDEKQKLPENEVNILVSVDPDADYMVLTGENILNTILPGSENVDIVNYLHDILYEFSSHRKLVIDLNERDIDLFQDYPQFGGRVQIIYDCTIPIFNIKEIKKADGHVLLECCTTGKLVDGNDRSFNDFKGFPDNNFKKGRKSYKKAKTVKCFYGNQTIDLDTNWEQPMENFWTLNGDAMISMSTIPAYTEYKNNLEKNKLFFIRTFTASNQGSYTIYNSIIIDEDGNDFSIRSEVYQPLKNKTIVNFKDFDKKDNSTSFDAFSLAVTKQSYIDNKKYYDDILDSYEN